MLLARHRFCSSLSPGRGHISLEIFLPNLEFYEYVGLFKYCFFIAFLLHSKPIRKILNFKKDFFGEMLLARHHFCSSLSPGRGH